jgi:hypothetical protein
MIPSAIPTGIVSQHGVAERELGGSVRGTEWGDELHRGEHDDRDRGERGGDAPHHGGRARHGDPHQARLLGVRCCGTHHETETRAGHEQREQDHQDRHRDEHADLTGADEQILRDLPAPVFGDQRGEVAAGWDVGQELREREHRETEELRDADGRHQQHEARGVRKATDDDDFEEHRRERGEGHRDQQARPQAPAVLGEHAEGAERDGSEGHHCEIDDPVRPVDEDEAGGDRAVGQADDRAGHHHLL